MVKRQLCFYTFLSDHTVGVAMCQQQRRPVFASPSVLSTCTFNISFCRIVFRGKFYHIHICLFPRTNTAHKMFGKSRNRVAACPGGVRVDTLCDALTGRPTMLLFCVPLFSRLARWFRRMYKQGRHAPTTSSFAVLMTCHIYLSETDGRRIVVFA